MLRTRPHFFGPAALGLLAACAGQGGLEESGEEAPYRLETYEPPPPRPALDTGELILACEQHLRAWQSAFAGPPGEATREKIHFTERALATLVHREQHRLEEQAVAGPPRNRGVASAALGFSGDEATLPLILNNVAASHQTVRANALLGVGALASADTPLGPLQQVARTPDQEPAVYRNLAFAGFRLASRLRHDPGGGLSSILIPLLERPEASVRAQAASALGMVGAAHTVPLLSDRALNDDAPLVRTAAAYALGEIGSPGSMEVLVRALDDSNRLTAGTARGSLVKIYGSDLGPDPEDWESALPQ